MPDTVLEIDLDGQGYRVSATAPRFRWRRVQQTGVDTAGRAALQGFIDALTGIPATDFVDQEHPYTITGLRIYAGKAIVVPDSEFPGEQPPIDWPLADLATAGLPVANSPLDLRCQIVDGDDLAKVLPLLETANALSTFRSEGELYSFTVRPLLPGESRLLARLRRKRPSSMWRAGVSLCAQRSRPAHRRDASFLHAGAAGGGDSRGGDSLRFSRPWSCHQCGGARDAACMDMQDIPEVEAPDWARPTKLDVGTGQVNVNSWP